MFSGKKITIGVTGGIAAYKACEIVSWLTQNGAQVQVIMTEGACHFVTPLTMKTLSNNPVAVDIMTEDASWRVPHIDAAACDVLCVVPATANVLAKAAVGIADDLLTATLLATTAPILAAPAMHCNMYGNPATQTNLHTLAERGWQFVEPGWGRLACGAEGQGRLADLDVIKDALTDLLLPRQDLIDKTVLVTAGPTREAIDAVRYLSNRSSGKMGYALAAAAHQRGAQVILVSGPTALSTPCGVERYDVVNAQEMFDCVWKNYSRCDIVIMAAAVADFTVADVPDGKIKKGQGLTPHFVPTKDILASLGANKGTHLLVGFAAESADLERYAKEKLQAKNLDLIVANDVLAAGAGFDVDTNIITLLDRDGNLSRHPQMSKKEAADLILDKVSKLPRF